MELRDFFNLVKERSIAIKAPVFSDEEKLEEFLSVAKNVSSSDINLGGVQIVTEKILRYNFNLHRGTEFESFFEVSGIDIDLLQEVGKKRELYSNLPHYEYKVVTIRDRVFFGDTRTDKVEEVLNIYASEGWRVISMLENTYKSEGEFTGRSHGELVITFERQAFKE